MERALEEVWRAVSLNASLWSSVNQSFCNYQLGEAFWIGVRSSC